MYMGFLAESVREVTSVVMALIKSATFLVRLQYASLGSVGAWNGFHPIYQKLKIVTEIYGRFLRNLAAPFWCRQWQPGLYIFSLHSSNTLLPLWRRPEGDTHFQCSLQTCISISIFRADRFERQLSEDLAGHRLEHDGGEWIHGVVAR